MMAKITYPEPDKRKLLENQRQRAARFAEEADEVLANHDLRRRGLEGTANTYHDIVARIDEELASLT